MSLRNERIVATGGTFVIGFATVKAARALGAEVSVTGRDEKKLQGRAVDRRGNGCVPTTRAVRTSVAALIVALLLAVPAGAQTPASDFLIAPGSGIGSVHLGMPIGEVLRLAGPPQPAFSSLAEQGATQASTGYRLYYWFIGQGTRTATANGEGRVVRLGVFNDPRFALRNGMHVGSMQAEVEQTLGTPSRISSNTQTGSVELAYDSLGIMFFVRGTPARVAGIEVEPVTQSRADPAARST